jgi:hypothetical protein
VQAFHPNTDVTCQYDDIRIGYRWLKVFELDVQIIQDMELHMAILHQQTGPYCRGRDDRLRILRTSSPACGQHVQLFQTQGSGGQGGNVGMIVGWRDFNYIQGKWNMHHFLTSMEKALGISYSYLLPIPE